MASSSLPVREVTRLLGAVRAGNRDASRQLFELVYGELRRLARRQLAGRRGDDTLGVTALVNEAYLKLAPPADDSDPQTLAHDREHFFSLAARAMRQILVDDARARLTAKRGSGQVALALDELEVAAIERATEVVAVDTALTQLEQLDARLAKVVEWRFFGGLTEEEIATTLAVSARTVRRDWVKARAFLFRQLAAEGIGSLGGNLPTLAPP